MLCFYCNARVGWMSDDDSTSDEHAVDSFYTCRECNAFYIVSHGDIENET